MTSIATKTSGATLLLVDVQKDFHPGGSLAIPTANDDAERIADLIRSHGTKIHRIVATLDSHHKLHIAHPSFWIGEDNMHPTPFTIISAEDITAGKWKPRDDIKLDLEELYDPAVFEAADKVKSLSNGSFDLTEFCLQYALLLEAKGRFKICIWPEHCLIGSPGHCVVDSIRSAIEEWSEKSGGSVQWVLKGQNLLTEMYSALEADVPVSKSTTFNSSLQESLLKSDLLLVCGQAMSHCVNYTLRDIVAHWPKDQTSKICLLSDCASAVPGFEAAAETFQTDMKAAGVQVHSVATAVGLLQ